MTVTIPKPLLSLEGTTVKDTELLQVRKGRKQREWYVVRGSLKMSTKTENSGFLLE